MLSENNFFVGFVLHPLSVYPALYSTQYVTKYLPPTPQPFLSVGLYSVQLVILMCALWLKPFCCQHQPVNTNGTLD